MLVKRILQQHPSEEIAILQYDGAQLLTLSTFSVNADSLCKAMYVYKIYPCVITLHNRLGETKPFTIVKSKTMAHALVQCFKFIQSVLGLDARAQITVLCDSSPFDGT